MKQVIGATTTYVGTDRREHPALAGLKVRIVAVLRAGDPDDDNAYVRDNETLARLGGLRKNDRVEVQPWIEKQARYSWVTSDPRVCDLKGYRRLIG